MFNCTSGRLFLLGRVTSLRIVLLPNQPEVFYTTYTRIHVIGKGRGRKNKGKRGEGETGGGGLGSVLVCRIFEPSVKCLMFHLFCVLDRDILILCRLLKRAEAEMHMA